MLPPPLLPCMGGLSNIPQLLIGLTGPHPHAQGWLQEHVLSPPSRHIYATSTLSRLPAAWEWRHLGSGGRDQPEPTSAQCTPVQGPGQEVPQGPPPPSPYDRWGKGNPEE